MTTSLSAIDVSDDQQYHQKLSALDHKLNAISKMRQYSRKTYVGNHRLDSVNTINVEDITKIYSKTTLDGIDAVVNH